MTPAAESPIPAEALSDLERLYARLEAELRALDLRCRACGGCCRFDEAEHVLFASDLERAFCLARSSDVAAAAPLRCPWQKGSACTAREGRPLGCRLHFCETTPETAAALEDLSIRMHEALRRIHATHGLGWRYRPFLTSLRTKAKAADASRTANLPPPLP